MCPRKTLESKAPTLPTADELARLLAELHAQQERLEATALVPKDMDANGIRVEIERNHTLSQEIADALWQVHAQNEVEDADWFRVANLVSHLLEALADDDGKVPKVLLMRAAHDFVAQRALPVQAAGIGFLESQRDEYLSILAVLKLPNKTVEQFDAAVSRLRDHLPSRVLLAAAEKLIADHPVMRKDLRRLRQGADHEERYVALYVAQHKAMHMLRDLRENLGIADD